MTKYMENNNKMREDNSREDWEKVLLVGVDDGTDKENFHGRIRKPG